MDQIPPGVVLGYTSLREQYVYRRAAQLYNAAFKLDPGKGGRTLAEWLRRSTPMAEDIPGGQPSQPRSCRIRKCENTSLGSAHGGARLVRADIDGEVRRAESALVHGRGRARHGDG